MNNNIIIMGAGRAGRFISGLATYCNYTVIGFVDDTFSIGERVDGIEVLGSTSDHSLKQLYNEYQCEFIISITNMFKREQLYNFSRQACLPLATLIHPTVIKHNSVVIGNGCVIQPFCTLQPGAKINDNVIIEELSAIGVDVAIGKNTVITPGVSLTGGGKVGENCFIGSNTVINPEITVEDNCIIGSGSTVIKDTKAGFIYAGSPALRIN
jgi:UDP-perosamine 4-acetyltransferase